jgi:hypothetical protein
VTLQDVCICSTVLRDSCSDQASLTHTRHLSTRKLRRNILLTCKARIMTMTAASPRTTPSPDSPQNLFQHNRAPTRHAYTTPPALKQTQPAAMACIASHAQQSRCCCMTHIVMHNISWDSDIPIHIQCCCCPSCCGTLHTLDGSCCSSQLRLHGIQLCYDFTKRRPAGACTKQQQQRWAAEPMNAVAGACAALIAIKQAKFSAACCTYS